MVSLSCCALVTIFPSKIFVATTLEHIRVLGSKSWWQSGKVMAVQVRAVIPTLGHIVHAKMLF